MKKPYKKLIFEKFDKTLYTIFYVGIENMAFGCAHKTEFAKALD
jgi:hypothetical protein